MPRWLLAFVVIIALVALDRAYMDGKNAAFIMSGVHGFANAFTDWVGPALRKWRQ